MCANEFIFNSVEKYNMRKINSFIQKAKNKSIYNLKILSFNFVEILTKVRRQEQQQQKEQQQQQSHS